MKPPIVQLNTLHSITHMDSELWTKNTKKQDKGSHNEKLRTYAQSSDPLAACTGP